MMRNLIVLGCAGLLAIGLSLAGNAGAPTDSDTDGVPDQHDNCIDEANGPDLAGGAAGLCGSQEDGDLDGYGSPCDFDADGDGTTTINDAIEFFAQAGAVGTDPVFDPDCDGTTTINDAINAFAASGSVTVPGPSGLACASQCGAVGFGCQAAGYPCP